MAVGSPEGGNRFELFVGPKDVDILRRVNPKLEQLVDFGWFAFIAKPVPHRPLDRGTPGSQLRLGHYRGHHRHQFAAVPAERGQHEVDEKDAVAAAADRRNQREVRRHQDARSEEGEQNQEVMDLYKKHGVNPAGGCVPMLLQIPFFIAFYKVLSVSIELRNANWLWVTDLSQPEHLPIRILPVAMIITQFLCRR